MIPPSELGRHLATAVALWTVVLVPGFALSRLLPRRTRLEGWPAWVAPGVAWWAAMLYVLPFKHGLYVAGGVALVGFAAAVWLAFRRRPKRKQSISRTAHRRKRLSTTVLVLGCMGYLTPLATQHVPQGMDASRYAANARLIAQRAGLPETLAPYAPEIPFGAVNHGLPAAAAMGVWAGGTAVGAVLAASQLAYASMLLATYLLLRLRIRRLPAAVIAVACTWLGRDLQASVGWGGFTQVMAFAMGLTAARFGVDLLRRPCLLTAPALGLLVAGMVSTHPIAAACWAYVVMPPTAVAAVWRSARRRRGLAAVGLAAMVAAGLIFTYCREARPGLDASATKMIRDLQAVYAPSGYGWTMLWYLPRYMARHIGDLLAGLGTGALLVLVVRGRWRMAGLLGLALLLLAAILVNAKLWLLPGSVLLYPDRVVFLGVPLCGLAMAGAWAVSGLPGRWRRSAGVVAAVVLLSLAAARHAHYFQRLAARPQMTDGSWEALLWCRVNLDPETAYVHTVYRTPGPYLRAVAGVAVTNFHSVFDQSAASARLRRSRRITHVFDVRGHGIQPPPGREAPVASRHLLATGGARVVFENESVTIHELPTDSKP